MARVTQTLPPTSAFPTERAGPLTDC